MILAIGNARANASRQTGFTLIEIVLVLGLVAVAAAVLITNFVSIASRDGTLTTEETLTAAIRRARFIAASKRISTELRFNEESKDLQISSGGEIESFQPDESFTNTRSAEIRFYRIPASRGLAPLADADRTNLQTEAVQFASDRSSTPFIAEIDKGSGTPERLQFDPFSSLVIQQKKEL